MRTTGPRRTGAGSGQPPLTVGSLPLELLRGQVGHTPGTPARLAFLGHTAGFSVFRSVPAILRAGTVATTTGLLVGCCRQCTIVSAGAQLGMMLLMMLACISGRGNAGATPTLGQVTCRSRRPAEATLPSKGGRRRIGAATVECGSQVVGIVAKVNISCIDGWICTPGYVDRKGRRRHGGWDGSAPFPGQSITLGRPETAE